MDVTTHVYIATSLDGFIARIDGSLDWLPTPKPEDKQDYGYSDFIKNIDVLVMGRNTFQKVATFNTWPYEEIKVFVLSEKGFEIPTFYKNKIEIISLNPVALLQYCQDRKLYHVYIDGGQTIQRFLQAGLINQMTITLVPVLIGQGISLFGSLEKDIQWQLSRSQSFDNGMVQNHYKLIVSN